MTAAVSIARYLLSEASSGTTPTTSADDTGNGNTLTVNYSSGDGNWTSNSQGNGFDFTAVVTEADAAVLHFDDISTNGNIGSSLDAVTEMSAIVDMVIDSANAGPGRIFAISTGSANGDFMIGANGSRQLVLRWNNGADTVFPSIVSVRTVAVVVDTTQATAADRINVYYDGSSTPETLSSGSYPAQNTTLATINNTNRDVTIGNRPANARGVNGQIYYAELFTGQLTTTQIADAHTQLTTVSNDTNWVATAAAITSVGGDDIVLDAELNAAFVTTGFTSEISTVQLVSGTSITNATGVTSTSGTGTFNLPDVSLYATPTVGAPLSTTNNVVVARLTDA